MTLIGAKWGITPNFAEKTEEMEQTEENI